MDTKRTIVNREEQEYYRGTRFEISIHNYDNQVFEVFASHEQETLDTLVDWLEASDRVGHFYASYEEVTESGLSLMI